MLTLVPQTESKKWREPELKPTSFASCFDDDTRCYFLNHLLKLTGIPAALLPRLTDKEIFTAFKLSLHPLKQPTKDHQGLLSLGDHLAIIAAYAFNLEEYPEFDTPYDLFQHPELINLEQEAIWSVVITFAKYWQIRPLLEFFIDHGLGVYPDL